MNKSKTLQRQIAALESAGLFALKEKFLELYGFECGRTSVRNLRKRLAFRLQEIYYGGVTAEDMAVLEALADKDPLANLKPVAAARLNKTKGTRYRRVWKGIEHEVIAGGDGTFEFGGEKYKSLSAVARKITGTRWNGKLFFGVR